MNNNNINKEIYNEINNIQSQKPNIIFWKNTKKGFNLLTRGIKRNGLKIAIILLILFIIIGFIYAYPTPIDGSYQDNATPGQRIASLFIIAALTSVITITLTIFDSESERHLEKDKEINQIKCKYNEFIFQLSKKYLNLNINYILENEINDTNINYKDYFIEKHKTLHLDEGILKQLTLDKDTLKGPNIYSVILNSSQIQPILKNDDLYKITYFNKLDYILLKRIRILFIYHLILQDEYSAKKYLQVLKELNDIFYDKDWNINENIKLKEESIVIKLEEIKKQIISMIKKIDLEKKLEQDSTDLKIIKICIRYYYNDIINILQNNNKKIKKEEINKKIKDLIKNKNADDKIIKAFQKLILEGKQKQEQDKQEQDNTLINFINIIFKSVCNIN